MSSGYRSIGDLTAGPYFEDKIWDGGDTPAGLRAQGVFTNNPYYFRKRWQTQTQGVWQDPRWGSWLVAYPAQNGLVANYNGSPAWNTPAALMAATLETYRSCDLDLGVSIFESKESWEMMAGRLFSLVGGARALRKGDLGGALRHFGQVRRGDRRRAQRKLDSGDISGAWLELYLGWTPLVRDLYSAACLLTEPKPPKFEFKSKIFPVTPPEITGFNLSVLEKNVFERTHSAVLVRPDWTERLGLTDPASIVWELIPFSFVVDYFLPIGDSIKAFHAIRNIPFEWCFRLRREKYRWTASFPKGTYWNGWVAQNSSDISGSRTEFDRAIFQPSIMDVTVGSLQFELPTKMKKVATLAALLHLNLLKMIK